MPFIGKVTCRVILINRRLGSKSTFAGRGFPMAREDMALQVPLLKYPFSNYGG